MDAEQVAKVLTKIRAFDNRKVESLTIAAWVEAIGDLDYRECLEAVAEHFRTSTDYIMPAHVRRLAEAIGSRRRAEAADEAIEARRALSGVRPQTTDRSREVLARLRTMLPPGRPEKLRGSHWLATHPEERRF